MNKIFKIIEVVILSLGLIGWLIWLYVFWGILLNPNPRGYYFNPFKSHNEFWFEFILIHIIVIIMISLLMAILMMILMESLTEELKKTLDKNLLGENN